jgi:hypothetical protein
MALPIVDGPRLPAPAIRTRQHLECGGLTPLWLLFLLFLLHL